MAIEAPCLVWNFMTPLFCGVNIHAVGIGPCSIINFNCYNNGWYPSKNIHIYLALYRLGQNLSLPSIPVTWKLHTLHTPLLLHHPSLHPSFNPYYLIRQLFLSASQIMEPASYRLTQAHWFPAALNQKKMVLHRTRCLYGFKFYTTLFFCCLHPFCRDWTLQYYQIDYDLRWRRFALWDASYYLKFTHRLYFEVPWSGRPF